MKSIFDTYARQEIVNRISVLSPQSKGQWGKMSVAEMAKHCALCENYYLGNIEVKRSMLGRLLGKSAIKSILKDEKSTIGRNAPTSPQFRVNASDLDLDTEKANWMILIESYANYNNESFVHWFFGKMTKEQLGQFIYKHCDHHLTQFGV